MILESLKNFLIEKRGLDVIRDVEKWYNKERKLLDNEKDYNTWKIKSKLLFKKYLSLQNEIERDYDDIDSFAGNMKVSYIYHYTTISGLINILYENMLIGGGDEFGGISFSSNGNLYKCGFVFIYGSEYTQGKNHTNVGVKMKFDFNMMKNDGFKFRKGSEFIGTHYGEEEIRLKSDELENVKKYLVEVILFEDKDLNYASAIPLLEENGIKYKIV